MNAHIQEKRSTGTEVLFVEVRQVAFSIAEIERLIFVFIMCCFTCILVVLEAKLEIKRDLPGSRSLIVIL